jgi:hypothetical protein
MFAVISVALFSSVFSFFSSFDPTSGEADAERRSPAVTVNADLSGGQWEPSQKPSSGNAGGDFAACVLKISTLLFSDHRSV